MKQTMETQRKNALSRLLDQITPLEQAKTDAKMVIAARISDAMKAKGWKKKDLLVAVGKETPSVITKWLSGTHNFTVETLVELENALGISLLHLEEPNREIVVTYHVEVRREVDFTETEVYQSQFLVFDESCEYETARNYSTEATERIYA